MSEQAIDHAERPGPVRAARVDRLEVAQHAHDDLRARARRPVRLLELDRPPDGARRRRRPPSTASSTAPPWKGSSSTGWPPTRALTKKWPGSPTPDDVEPDPAAHLHGEHRQRDRDAELAVEDVVQAAVAGIVVVVGVAAEAFLVEQELAQPLERARPSPSPAGRRRARPARRAGPAACSATRSGYSMRATASAARREVDRWRPGPRSRSSEGVDARGPWLPSAARRVVDPGRGERLAAAAPRPAPGCGGPPRVAAACASGRGRQAEQQRAGPARGDSARPARSCRGRAPPSRGRPPRSQNSMNCRFFTTAIASRVNCPAATRSTVVVERVEVLEERAVALRQRVERARRRSRARAGDRR